MLKTNRGDDWVHIGIIKKITDKNCLFLLIFKISIRFTIFYNSKQRKAEIVLFLTILLKRLFSLKKLKELDNK